MKHINEMPSFSKTFVSYLSTLTNYNVKLLEIVG